MVAPIDAKATLEVEGETFTLAMNMRTFALAKQAGFNFFAMKAGDQLDAFDLTAILKAFATPAHPAMTEEEAFAIALRHGDALGATIQRMSEEFGAQVKAGDARPPKARQRK